jgi:hypothetical protein
MPFGIPTCGDIVTLSVLPVASSEFGLTTDVDEGSSSSIAESGNIVSSLGYRRVSAE